jgi:Helix-turn-helix
MATCMTLAKPYWQRMFESTVSSGADPAVGIRSGIDLTYMGGIERGKRNPSLLVMARIAEALGVQLPKLLGE